MRARSAKSLVVYNLSTVEPRFNEVAGDRPNLFVKWRVRYIEVLFSLFHTFYCNFGRDIEITVEPRFNEPLFNEVLDITNDILCPGQSYSKMYGIEPRCNEPRYNEFFDITNIMRKPKRKIYLDITNYNVNTRQKINAE